jgi:hypothetical protein
MGLDVTTDPAITAAALTFGGAAIDVTASRPNGRTIQTGARLQSGFSAEIVDASAGLVRLTKASDT